MHEPIFSPHRWLSRLAQRICRSPRWFVYPHIILFAAAVAYTVAELDFHTNRNDLVGADKKYHHNFLQFKEEFGAQDDLVTVVESDDREKNRQFVERLGAKLENEPELFTDVFYKGDLKMLGRKALLFLPGDALEELRVKLTEYQPLIRKFAASTNLDSFFRQVNNEFRQASRAEDDSATNLIGALPALTRIVRQADASLDRPGTPPSPGITALFDAGEEAESAEYITFANGRIYLATARAPRENLNAAAVDRLRELVRETQREVPGVNVGLTGEPVLEYDEMRQSQKDSVAATGLALFLVACIFIYAYRETGRPLKATLCLVVGLGYTMAYTTFVVGHLNILTVTFLPILVGLAIDFGIHLITRYEEEVRHGAAEREGLEKAIVNTGMGIFTGCFTSAGAFFAMALTDFKGIQEMGIITGGGMLVCLIPMMTLLPALLLRGGPNRLDRRVQVDERRARLERLWLDRPRWVLAFTITTFLLAASQLRQVRFDYNLLHMQTRGLPAVAFENKLIDSASKSVLFGAVVADSLEEAVRLQAELEALPAVSEIDSLSQFLAADAQSELEKVQAIKELAGAIDFAPVDTEPPDLAELGQTLFYTQSYLGLAIEAVEKEDDQALLEQLRELDDAISELRYRLSVKSRPKDAARFGLFQQAFFNDLAQTFQTLRRQDASGRLEIEDLPPALRDRFVGRTGKHLLQVYPKRNIWERGPQEEFVRQIRAVDADATGTPVQLFEYTTLLKDSYVKAAWYALGAIVLLVLIHFRSLASVALALLPVLIGATWTAGLMGWFDIPFNPANIMMLPLVIGIGVTNGIHILNRFAEEQNPAILAKSTGKAVLVSALTTVAGFGSLLQADHQGIASLGLVMVLGVTACMVSALTFLPTLLNLLIRRGWNPTKKKPSGDNAQSSLGREEPR